MDEQAPIKLNPKDVGFLDKVTELLGQPEKPFVGAVINGTFVSPRPDLTTEQQESLKEIKTKIQQHKS